MKDKNGLFKILIMERCVVICFLENFGYFICDTYKNLLMIEEDKFLVLRKSTSL